MGGGEGAGLTQVKVAVDGAPTLKVDVSGVRWSRRMKIEEEEEEEKWRSRLGRWSKVEVEVDEN